MGAIQVASARKGAKSRTHGRRNRSTGTKARACVKNGSNSLVELKNQLEERTRELAEARAHLAEALAQQTAASEVLRVISSSPSELEPVFRAVLANATRLCEASYGALWLCDGDGYRTGALHGPRPGTLYHPDPETSLVRATKTGQAVQVAAFAVPGLLSFARRPKQNPVGATGGVLGLGPAVPYRSLAKTTSRVTAGT